MVACNKNLGIDCHPKFQLESLTSNSDLGLDSKHLPCANLGYCERR